MIHIVAVRVAADNQSRGVDATSARKGRCREVKLLEATVMKQESVSYTSLELN